LRRSVVIPTQRLDQGTKFRVLGAPLPRVPVPETPSDTAVILKTSSYRRLMKLCKPLVPFLTPRQPFRAWLICSSNASAIFLEVTKSGGGGSQPPVPLLLLGGCVARSPASSRDPSSLPRCSSAVVKQLLGAVRPSPASVVLLPPPR